MGYRVRLGKIPKWTKEKYSKANTEDEWFELFDTKDEDGDFKYTNTTYDPEEYTELYEIGKYVSFDEGLEKFYNFETEDTEFYIMTKAGLKAIINWYNERVFEYYKNDAAILRKICENKAIKDDEVEKLMDVCINTENKVREWEGRFFKPYYLDEIRTDGYVARSWKYEYAIFNLVYIYRSFDWENDYLIYSGW